MTDTMAEKLTALTDSVVVPGRTVAAVAGLLEQARRDEVVVVWEDQADLVGIDDVAAFISSRSCLVSVML